MGNFIITLLYNKLLVDDINLLGFGFSDCFCNTFQKFANELICIKDDLNFLKDQVTLKLDNHWMMMFNKIFK